MRKSEYTSVVKIFAIWLFCFSILIVLFVKYVPYKENFLGGGLANYLKNPYLWALSNFDGEHYLSIASNGYRTLTYFFFPLYPTIIHLLGNIFGNGLFVLNIIGASVSVVSLLFALFGLHKLLSLDFDEKTTYLIMLLVLLFPTSFYFATVYTESLFFALAVWTFYFARKSRWGIAAFLGVFLTATRIVGIAILPALLAEWFIQYRKKLRTSTKPLSYISFVPLGLVSYLAYVWYEAGNVIEVFKNVSIFGPQRSSSIILLPQVFYRYIFKILPSLNTNYFPVIFTTYLEFMIGTVFLLIIVFSFRKLRLSYWVFLLLGYLIPTLSGSFSSLPRYVLVLFPAYIFAAILLSKNKFLLFAFIVISTILLVVSFGLFARGYWIS